MCMPFILHIPLPNNKNGNAMFIARKTVSSDKLGIGIQKKFVEWVKYSCFFERCLLSKIKKRTQKMYVRYIQFCVK